MCRDFSLLLSSTVTTLRLCLHRSINSEAVSSPTQARCFEEENEFLESQILDLEESGPSAGVSGTGGAVADCSLDAVVERLRRERVRRSLPVGRRGHGLGYMLAYVSMHCCISLHVVHTNIEPGSKICLYCF